MKTQFTEHKVNVNCLSEFDPAPFIYSSGKKFIFKNNMNNKKVLDLIRTYQLCSLRSITDVLIKGGERSMLKKKKGQSTMEYVIVLTAIVTALLAAILIFAKKDYTKGVAKTYKSAIDKMTEETGYLNTFVGTP